MSVIRLRWVAMVALTVALTGGVTSVRAASSASGSIAGEIRATDAQNRQLDAAMAGLRPVRPARHKKAAGAIGARPSAGAAAAPVIATPSGRAAHDEAPGTAGRHYEVGPVTITPGGFFSVGGLTR